MKAKTYIKIISFLIIALVFTSCSRHKGNLSELTITYVKTPLNVPSIVERNHSMYEKELNKSGVKKVNYVEIPQGSLQINALLSKDVDILNALGASSVIIAASKGAPLKIISIYSRSPKAFRIYAVDESIKTASDLKGKTIAGAKGSNLHELLISYLNTVGLKESDVNFVNMNLTEALVAGIGRKVDAVLLAGSASVVAEQNGLSLLTTGEGLMNGLIVSATTSEFYENNKELVENFKSAQKTVLDFIENNKSAAFKETADALSTTLENVESQYPYYDFSPAITESDIASLQQTALFLHESGLIDTSIDIQTLLGE